MTASKKPSRKMHPLLKGLFFGLIAFVILCTAFVTLLPTLVSTEWGRKKVLMVVNSMIPGEVTVGYMNLGLTSRQEVHDLQIRGSDGEIIVKLPFFSMESPLYTLLSSRPDFQKITLNSPHINLIREPEGTTNLHNALGIRPSSSEKKEVDFFNLHLDNPKISFPLKGEIILTDGHFSIGRRDEAPASLSNVNASLIISDGDEARFSLKGTTQLGDSSGNFDVEAYIKGLNKEGELFLKQEEKGFLVVEKGHEISLRAQLHQWPVEIFDSLLESNPEIPPHLISRAIGARLDLLISKSINSEGLQAELRAKAERLATEISLRTANSQIELTRPGHFSLTLTPHFIHSFLDDKSELTFARPLTIELMLQRLSMPIQTERLEVANTSFLSLLHVSDLEISSLDRPSFILRQMEGKLESPALFNFVTFDFQTTVRQGRLEAPFHIQSRIDHLFDGDKRKISTSLTGKALPTGFLETVADLPTSSLKALGTHFNIAVRGVTDQDELQLALLLQSEALKVKGDGKITNSKTLIFDNPIEMIYHIKPEFIRNIFPLTPEVTRESIIKMEIAPTTVVLGEDLLSLIELNGTITSQPISFVSPSVTLQELAATWSISGPQNLGVIHLNALGLHENNPGGNIEIDASITDWRKNDALFLNNIKGKVAVIVDNFSSALLGALIGQEDLSEMVGPNITINIQGQTNGPLAVNVEAEHFRAYLGGRLQQGMLTLSEPLEAQMDVTRALSKNLLKGINPLLITAIASDKPIRFIIEPENFQMQMMPLDLSTLQVGKGYLELNKLILDNGGPLGFLVGFLKARSLSGMKSMDVWFTPQYFSVHDGVVFIERTDYLIADTFHMSTWGSVDLPRDNINMTIAVHGETLRHAFGISKLTDGLVIKLPMHGSTAHPKIDTTKALTKITSLIAQDKAGSTGSIISGILNLVSDGRDDDNVPPPTTTPFPWDSDPTWKSNRQRAEMQIHESHKEPMKENSPPAKNIIDKQIEKGLKNLFKNF